MDSRLKLTRVAVSGFKSLAAIPNIEFGDITVLIGANGAGKSNLVSFFKMLNYMMTGGLQRFVGENGGADSLLHYGASTTPLLQAEIGFVGGSAEDAYAFKLAHAAGDTLIFTDERVSYRAAGFKQPQTFSLGAGQKETGLFEDAKRGNQTSGFVFDLLRACRVFQFHDTSNTAKIRNQGYIDQNEFLYSDAGNLAAFLFALKSREDDRKYYDRIVQHIRVILPQFGDFELRPSALNDRYIRLNWRESGADYLFGPHQISDGALRFMALTALLLQPPSLLPRVIVLDEPELGLHPAAIASLAGMVRSASRRCQLILATQSARLVDEFAPEDIVVVERNRTKPCSEFHRLEPETLADWIERYSLSELWEKNVLGGRP